MGVADLPRLDGSQPWMAPYRTFVSALQQSLDRGSSVAEALSEAAREPGAASAAGECAPRFVPMRELPQGEAYERFVARTGRVPVRDDLHDLCNGLVWLRFPGLKRALNEAHAAAPAGDGNGSRRGAVRDVLTLFDESGAFVAGPDDLLAALRAHAWRELFVDQRPRWRAEAAVTVVGHALLAKLATPYKAITAHAWPAGTDANVAARAGSPRLTPLPVLGVPGWWPANELAAYYDDAAVFRPPRSSRSTPAGR